MYLSTFLTSEVEVLIRDTYRAPNGDLNCYRLALALLIVDYLCHGRDVACLFCREPVLCQSV